VAFLSHMWTPAFLPHMWTPYVAAIHSRRCRPPESLIESITVYVPEAIRFAKSIGYDSVGISTSYMDSP
jgi:hypothetical protein